MGRQTLATGSAVFLYVVHYYVLDYTSPEFLVHILLNFVLGQMPPNSLRSSLYRMIDVNRKDWRCSYSPSRVFVLFISSSS